MENFPHCPYSPLPMLPIIALLQLSTSKETSPSLEKASGPPKINYSLSPSTPFRTSPSNSLSSIPRNSTYGLNTVASYKPMTWVASLFVPEAETAILFWHIISTPITSLSQRSNHAMTSIAFLTTTASFFASNPRATALIFKSLTMRMAPSITAPSLTSVTAPYRLSCQISIA